MGEIEMTVEFMTTGRGRWGRVENTNAYFWQCVSCNYKWQEDAPEEVGFGSERWQPATVKMSDSGKNCQRMAVPGQMWRHIKSINY